MHLFHSPDLQSGHVELSAEEAHHAAHVLRLAVGARIGLLNGRGTSAEAELVEVSKNRVMAEVIQLSEHPPERQARIHLAVAPTKQIDRFEWMLEKCTEIGVDRITPLMTDRTGRGHLRMDRLQKVLLSAMKQSQRKWLPVLDEITVIDDMIRTANAQQRLFGWCEGVRSPLAATFDPKADVLLLIGPEGDFTTTEAKTLLANAFVPVSLGKARLRTETAAIAACTWMNFAGMH